MPLVALPPPLPCNEPVLALRCPNLVMAPPHDFSTERTRHGRTILRMGNRIVNVGSAPLEIRGRRSGKREMSARQIVGSAKGRRSLKTGGELYFKSVPSRGGSYWKFDEAARFELWRLGGDGRRTRLVRTSPKLDYCLRDLSRTHRSHRSPRQMVFPACNQSASKRGVTLGISVGWAHGYPASYPENYIDVTGRHGCYAVLQRADPANHILESDEGDNVSHRVVRLPLRKGRPSHCPRYTAGIS